MRLWLKITLLLLTGSRLGLAQGFVDLDFESAQSIVDPNGANYPYDVAITNAVPGWAVFGTTQGDMLYNDPPAGSFEGIEALFIPSHREPSFGVCWVELHLTESNVAEFEHRHRQWRLSLQLLLLIWGKLKFCDAIGIGRGFEGMSGAFRKDCQSGSGTSFVGTDIIGHLPHHEQ